VKQFALYVKRLVTVRPDDRRLFFLIDRASHALRQRAERACAEQLDTTSAQLGALFHLVKHDGCRAKDLASALGINQGAITGLVDRMEQAGLVRRRTHQDDGRAWRLHATAAGKQVVENARPLLAWLQRELTDGFTAAEIDVVARFLRNVVDRADQDLAERRTTTSVAGPGHDPDLDGGGDLKEEDA
jgi:DNA-binding MarR family transcriptional regulator